MRGLKVPKRDGEKVRNQLIQQGYLVTQYKIKRDETYIYFPVKEGIPGYEVVECSFEEQKKPVESLKKFGISSFDSIGDIAIVDIPEELQEKRKEIARVLLTRPFIKTVVQKSSRVEGEFRTRTYEYIAGEQKTETVHREYGLKYRVDINTVYFNPRLATERLRIARKVTPGEVVIDMFCGVGPFSIMISQFSKAEKIYAIDVNPEAMWFLKENIKLNNVKNITPIMGDAKEKIAKTGHADRIIMNLPQKAFEFLPEAVLHGDTIHYYRITSDVQGEIEQIKSLKTKKTLKILQFRTVKSYSPDMEMCRIDISTK